jgi:hypothetical protein
MNESLPEKFKLMKSVSKSLIHQIQNIHNKGPLSEH